jgi:peroxisomal 2,4-dienoyl-CoA reductase
MSVFKDDVLKGKVALVTGGGSGICKGIAHAFLAHGAKVAIVSRNFDRLGSAATELSKATGGECLPIAADVRDFAAVGAAVGETVKRLGRLDVLVNGAAGNFLAPASLFTPNGFRAVMEIDAFGTFHASRAAFDGWMQEHGGNVINISATLQLNGTAMQIHAAAAKAAIDSMTRTLAVEWGGAKIRVNGIAPGPIDDTEGMKRLAGEVGLKEKIEKDIPIGRFGRIDEIANVAVFLASEAASLVHGETIIVDGGAWLTMSSMRLLA